MATDIETFAKEFAQLCRKHKVFPTASEDGDIKLGYDEESNTRYNMYWQGTNGMLITYKPDVTETDMGVISTVTPEISVI